MKKKYQYLIIFLILTITTFIYSLYISIPIGDEFWNYGFAHNIYTGLIPYKDFNMIITPLFAFSTVPIFFLFGDTLLNFHIYNAFIVGLIIILMSKKIGKQSLLIYPLIILGYLPSYNLFALFLFTILILVNDSKSNNKDIYLAIIVSLIFLTKQTIGLALLIPCIYYSKNKVKTIISFLIPNIIFLIYLIFNNALYNFIDYCFLGMLNFTKSNGSITINTIITIGFSLLMLYKLIKSKLEKKYYFYGLMFQVVALPMGDKFHFFIAFTVVVYTLLIEYELSITKYIYLTILTYSTLFLSIFFINIKENYEINIYKEKNLYYGRNISENINNYLNNYQIALKYAQELGYDHLFVFSNHTYFLKLSQNQKLNKFDLINNGNMGYNSSKGYIKEIEKICQNKKCLFIVETYPEGKNLGQTNIELLNYPQEASTLKYKIAQFEIYKSEK